MNTKQKYVTLVFIAFIFMSVVYVPQEALLGPTVMFQGYVFIGDLSESIALKVILVEWVGIILISLALYKYFE
jgi:hypothetical protein